MIYDDPKFIIFTGPMFGGKTSKMFAALEREKYRSRKILACKPKMDHRYDDDHISTHTGYKWPAHRVSSGQEIIDLANKRTRFREQKDWKTADNIRKQIEKLGFELEDTPKGPKIKRI